MADAATVQEITKAPVGFAGPVGLEIPVYADAELQAGTDYVVGANAGDAHLVHVDLKRDAAVTACEGLAAASSGAQRPSMGDVPPR